MESKVLKTALNAIKFVIIVLGAVYSIMILVSETNQEAAPYVDNALSVAFWSLILCIAGSLLFSIYLFFAHFRRSINALIGIVLFLVVIGISYSMASPMVLESWSELDYATPAVSQMVGGGLNSILALVVIAIAAIIVSEVIRLFK